VFSSNCTGESEAASGAGALSVGARRFDDRTSAARTAPGGAIRERWEVQTGVPARDRRALRPWAQGPQGSCRYTCRYGSILGLTPFRSRSLHARRAAQRPDILRV
jgi:hypothetical protein